jgi:hypothetical protein
MGMMDNGRFKDEMDSGEGRRPVLAGTRVETIPDGVIGWR